MDESTNIEAMLDDLKRVWFINSNEEFDSSGLEKLLQDLLFNEKQWVKCLEMGLITREEFKMGVLQYLYTWFSGKLNIKENEVKGLSVELVERLLSTY